MARSTSLGDVRALMVLWKTVVDAMDTPTISAHVRDELLGTAYVAVFQDYLGSEMRWSLKIVPLEGALSVTPDGVPG